MANSRLFPSIPRLTGDAVVDVGILAKWAQDFSNAIVFGELVIISDRVRIGSLTASGTSATVQADFDDDEPMEGADYVVLLTRTGSTGSPAGTSDEVATITKTATGFAVTFKAAPGAGASVTFDYLVHSLA